ncbi:MAG: hypothetical protein ABR525_04750 [Candidatus Limnocylindria bacterium]
MKTFDSVEELVYRVAFDGTSLTIADAAGEGCAVRIPPERQAAVCAALHAVTAEAVLDPSIVREHVSARLFSGDLRVYAADGHVNIQILDSERDLANYVRLTPADAKALAAEVGRSAGAPAMYSLGIAS